MGSFNNTKINDTVTSLTEGFKSRLDNPFYDTNGKSRIIITYYAINTDATHKDPALSIVEDNIGVNSPIKYNKIHDFIVYTDDIMLTTSINETDFGPECDPFEGKFYIMPGTIEPTVGDHFKIPHVKEDLLFKITEIQSFRLDSGKTLDEVSWILVENTTKRIEENVIENYDFIVQNIGTDLNPLILSSNFKLAKNFDSAISVLRQYYLELFFSESTQSLIFVDSYGKNIYDEMLTEFCKETGVLSTSNNFVYLTNQIPQSHQFNYNYNKTLFAYIVDKDIERIKNKRILNYGWLENITRRDCIFYTKPKAYFSVNYSTKAYTSLTKDFNMIPFDNTLIDNIIDKQLVGDDILSDMIVKYFNDITITDDDIEQLKYIDIDNISQQFYYIPCIIYILEYNVKQLLKREE